MNVLLAQVVVARWHDQWTFGGVIIAIIIIAAIIGVLYVALRKFGVEIPEWVAHIFWICVVAFVAIMAVKFLLSLS